jgi:predicted amidohydrolase YtcJ
MRDKVFGPKKVMLLDRCESVEKAGLTWTMHSDAPVSPLGDLQMIRAARGTRYVEGTQDDSRAERAGLC